MISKCTSKFRQFLLFGNQLTSSKAVIGIVCVDADFVGGARVVLTFIATCKNLALWTRWTKNTTDLPKIQEKELPLSCAQNKYAKIQKSKATCHRLPEQLTSAAALVGHQLLSDEAPTQERADRVRAQLLAAAVVLRTLVDVCTRTNISVRN